MRRLDPLKQLADAADLLYMLELLSTGLASNAKGELPWPGIKLTLRQAREAVLNAKETLSLEGLENEPRQRALPRTGGGLASSSLAGGGLADRVLQVSPSEGRVRELVDRGISRDASPGVKLNQPAHSAREKLMGAG